MPEGRGSQSFLGAVWQNRQGYVFLPFKDLERRWHETSGIHYDGTSIPSVEDIRADLYFCPVVFSRPQRKKEFAQPTNLLWADLDPVHPEKCRLKPTIAWESSPGRYQALWFLSTDVTAEEAAALSKRIAYADGADKGGWDVTQVLRVPGTRNYKYDSAPPVKLLWSSRSAYSVSEIKAAYPAVNGDATNPSLTIWPTVDESTVQNAIQSLPLALRTRITRNPAGADRSKELQMLARDLLKKHVEPDVVAHILQRSTFNKFAGRPSEHRDLLRQVESAIEAVGRQKPTAKPPEIAPIEQMAMHKWGDFLSIPTRLRWLVDEAWVDGSVGFISGRSKSYKTWIALDLALSIVSGEPFLGRYPVRRTGPVLLIQEEDPSSVLQERLRLIGKSKGMLPELKIARPDRIRIEYPDYPLHIINLQGFNLGVTEKVAQVRQTIAEIKPVLVILDPLIVLLPQGVDEYKGVEVSAVLQSIKMWREEFGCGVAIVHHWNKAKNEDGERFAEHMYGSFAFHAWLESALHVMPVIEEEQERIDTVVIEREFKAAPSGRSLQIKFKIDSVDKYEYHVEFDDDRRLTPMAQQLLDMIAESGTTGCTTPEMVTSTGHPRSKVVDHLQRMVRHKMIRVMEQGGGRGKTTRYCLADK
jgi:RecA-family ATPase